MRCKMEMNTKKFSDSVTATISAIGFGSQQILVEEAEEIMELSKSLCPRDTGALVNSAFVEVTKARKSSPEVTFGYSGKTFNEKRGVYSSTYAVIVHEDLDARHSRGEAKFLEKAVNQYAKKYHASLSRKMAWIFKR